MSARPEAATSSPPRRPTPDPRVVALALLALSVVALALRLPWALSWPLWYDEAETWLAARASFGEFLRWHAHPFHPSFSFAVVRLATDVLGTRSEWALRLPSLASSVLAVPAVYWLGRAGLSHRVGLGCAALVAVHPEFVFQGLTARMYAILVLLVLVAFILALDIDRRDRPSTRRWIALGAVIAAACWTHFLGFSLWAGLAVAVVDRVRRSGPRDGTLRGFAIASLVVAASLLPAASRLLDHLSVPFRMIGALLAGRGVADLQALPIPPIPEGYLPLLAGFFLALLVLLLLGVPGLFLAVRRARFFTLGLVATALSSLPIVVFAAGILVAGLSRYLVLVWLVWMVGLSTFAFESDRRWASVLGVVLIVLLAVASVTLPRPVMFDAGEMVERVARERSSAEATVLFHPCRMGMLGAYYGLQPNPPPDTPWNRACPWEPGDPLPHATTWLVLGDVLPVDERMHDVVADLSERYGADFEADEIVRLLASYTALAIRFDPEGHRVLVPERTAWPEGMWDASAPRPGEAAGEP